MMFAHVLRDDSDNIVTVHLDKCVDFDSEIYKTNSDTYEELEILSERYEESILESGNLRWTVNSEDSDDSESETGNIQNDIVNYADRRQRRGRGSRYYDILAALKQ